MVIVERLLELQTDKEDALILLNEYSKLSTIGQSMINISHQWKEPINQIYCILNNIEAAKEFNDKKLSTILDSSIKDIKNITKYMANTGSNFLELYNDKRKIDKIAIIESLYFSIAILKDEIDKSNIFIDFDIEETCTLLLDKYLISNVFIIVIENSLKIFKQKKIENPKIFIKSSQTKEKIIVNICDNGGGISIFPIESIFEKDLTSRESTGIGLFLAKNILKTKLNGDIKATNTNDGVCFEIALTI
jgi:C4-dicarboxylate-specific signal transduction histidine kinase